MIRTLLYSMVTCWALVWMVSCSGTPEQVVGTETGNGTRLVGIVVDENGEPVEGVTVQLYVAGSFPPELSATETSNGEGEFNFSEIDSGLYNIEANDPDNQTKFLLTGVEAVEDGDSLHLGSHTLQPGGDWVLHLADSIAVDGGTIYIPGTSISRTITKAEAAQTSVEFKDVYPGTYDNIVFSANDDVSAPQPLDMEIEILPAGKTIFSVYHNWSHAKPISIETDFLTETVANYPMLVRLSDSVLNFSDASADGDDIRFSDRLGNPLPFQIETWDASGKSASIWLMLDSILSGNNENLMTLHWGGPAEMQAPPPYQLPGELNYAGVWHLAEDPGDAEPQFKDESGTANHGTWQGTPSPGLIPGIIGNAAQLNGVDQSILPAVLDTNPSHFSISMWFKTSSNISGYLIQYAGVNGFDRSIWVDTAGYVKFGVYEDSSFIDTRPYNVPNPVNRLSSTSTFNDGNWHHVTASFEPFNFRLYVNGMLESSTDTVAYASNHYGNWWMGTGAVGSWDDALIDGFFLGSLDEVRVRYTVPSDSRVRLDYETQREGSGVVVFE